MFDSGVTVKSIIDKIKTEDDICDILDDDFYYDTYAAAEQLLYSEIIGEKSFFNLNASSSPLTISGTFTDMEIPSFEDIEKVFAINSDENNIELEKADASFAKSFDNMNIYWNDNGRIGYSTSFPTESICVVYNVRPKNIAVLRSSAGAYQSVTAKLPFEFLDLIRAKLRGEKYKLANNEILAAKWLDDYNKRLSDFKVYISERRETLTC